jgi:hypothetical protein
MVKLDSFSVFSTKNQKNQFLQKKISKFSADQFSPFGLKFFLIKKSPPIV